MVVFTPMTSAGRVRQSGSIGEDDQLFQLPGITPSERPHDRLHFGRSNIWDACEISVGKFSAKKRCMSKSTSNPFIYEPLQWRHNGRKSPASRLFTQAFIQTQTKENIKAACHWPWCGEFTGDRWIPRTNDQERGRCFHLMTSSWQPKIPQIIGPVMFDELHIFAILTALIILNIDECTSLNPKPYSNECSGTGTVMKFPV